MIYDVQGHAAYCYTGGKAFDPSLPTAVFIHGVQNDHSVWILQTRYFANHGFNVLALDLPGHGRSKGAALATVEQLAQWVIALLDAAGVDKALLIGHSLGSLIALEAAHLAPQRVGKLALLGAAFPMKVSDVLLKAARDDVPAAVDMVNIWSHSSMAQKPSCPGPGFSTMGGSQRLMQRIAARSAQALFHIGFTACNRYANGEIAARTVACPTQFIVGSKDMMTPARATKLLTGAIAHARIDTVDAGHQMMAEQPDAVLETLYRFAVATGA